MDATKRKQHPNPRETASLPSLIFYAWLAPFFRLGWRKPIEVDDLYDPLKADRSELLGNKLNSEWEQEVVRWKQNCKRHPSLLRSLIRTFWRDICVLAIYLVVTASSSIGQCLFLRGVLAHFRPGSSISRQDAMYCAGGLVSCIVIEIMTRNRYDLSSFHFGLRLRAACCALIYWKSLRLSHRALGNMASGQVVNLLSNDVSRFEIMAIFLHYMWMAPLQTVIIMYLLWSDGGYPALFGMAVFLTIVPLQSYIGKLSSKFRRLIACRTDERVRLVNEVVSGIQVIKMYAWEKPFIALLGEARRRELFEIRKTSIVRGIFMTFHLCTCRLALFFSLVGLTLYGTAITADKVFVFFSYYNILTFALGSMFVRGWAEISESVVSIQRIQKYMLYEEFRNEAQLESDTIGANESSPNLSSNGKSADDKQNNTPLDDKVYMTNGKNKQDGFVSHNTNAVTLRNFVAQWSVESSDPTLNNINLHVSNGNLLAIIGPVGSGKSSILQAILGELPKSRGDLQVNGKISYASQDPWVFAATVRQNILFGSPYDRKRYDKVVKVCALKKDFEQLPKGDLTLVGERGVSLSGGQRARINLARAVYREADIYLLDDPLSAVDTHVGKHLFEECICNYLRHKTVVLVTHQLQYMKGADRIIVVSNGTTLKEGTFDDLVNSGNDYAQLLKQNEEDTDPDRKRDGDSSSHKSNTDCHDGDMLQSYKRHLSVERRRSHTSSYASSLQSIRDIDEEDEEPEASSPLVDAMEASSKGVVKGSVYLRYFQACGSWCLFIIVLVLFLLAQIGASGTDYWVALWARQEEKRFSQNTLLVQANKSRASSSAPDVDLGNNSVRPFSLAGDSDLFDKDTSVYIYSTILFSMIFWAAIRSAVYYCMVLRISQRLHDYMFSSVIKTSMHFFNTSPSGRILNRFSKDMGSVDEILPKIILDATQILLNLAGALALSIMTNYWLLVPVIFMAFIFRLVQRVYLKTSKNVKRLEGIVRSPVFSHLNVTLQGMTTIRAFGAEDILQSEFNRHQDLHSSAWFMAIAGSCAFCMALDFLSLTYNVIVIVSLFLTSQENASGNVGLAITQSMALTNMLQWGIRQATEVANNMMSAERVLEYVQLPPEETKSNRDSEPSDDWPQRGEINLDHVYLRYSSADAPVLHDLNIHIKPAEKVGIVGRTGAGKSSLIATLFRMAIVEGKVQIDGIDTGNVCLEKLRSAISIIPQDPVLFSGTLRYNLDPFHEYPDEQLWRAVSEVELKDLLTEQQGLSTRVLERGSNFSVGQRQLVCLARAILRANRVLMLDEATANVDPQTDALIQRTIREKFRACTVLTVAHRLNTVIDSDRVLVMDNGTVVEFDHAHILLQRPDSMFLSMVQKTGPHAADQLCRAAKQAHNAD